MPHRTPSMSGRPGTIASPGGPPSLIRWGAVFAGAVIGLSLLILLSALWSALAFATGVEAIGDNLAWYIGGSAIAAMFVGGITAGWLSGVPGAGPGFFNGLTVWALALVVGAAVGIPGALGMMGITMDGGQLAAPGQEMLVGPADALWAGFISLLIGALTAGIGGMIGGALTRPAYAPMAAHTMTDERDPMPVGASDRGYDLADERAYDERTIPEEERRDLREPERRGERADARTSPVPPPPRGGREERHDRGDGWK